MPRPVYETTATEIVILAALRDSLRDPTNPKSCCALGIQTATTMLTTNAPEEMAKDGRQTQILRAIVHFLTHPRSDEELRNIKAHLNQCHCDMRNSAIARLHHGATTPPNLDSTLFSLCTVLTEVLTPLPVGTFRKIRRNTIADAQPWPNSPADMGLTSAGAAATLTAMLDWATTPPNGYPIFLALGSMARFWEPFAREVFRSERAFVLATNQIQYALDHYDPDAEYLAHMKTFQVPVMVCAEGFFFTLLARDAQAMVPALEPVVDHMKRIAVRILPILRGIGASVGRSVTWFDKMSRLNPSPENYPNNSAVPASAFTASNYPVMFGQLVHIRNTNQCMNLACERPLGIKTAVCNQCGVVRYCNANCQRPAWRAASIPHKPLCTAIHSLRTVLQLQDAAEWESWTLRTNDTVVKPHRQTGDFDRLCHARGVNPELTLRIWSYMNELTEAKLRRLDEMETRNARRATA
ncbi:hypothetical protein DFH06DRAFT_1226406 [Mycena polygramma]|nr:hypothetical protein DFH06DRAFT_1226406 [Mycena polygramma]